MEEQVIKFKACAPPHCNCPEITVKNKKVIITDDYNGQIVITEDQFDRIIDWYKSQGGDPYCDILPIAHEKIEITGGLRFDC